MIPFRPLFLIENNFHLTKLMLGGCFLLRFPSMSKQHNARTFFSLILVITCTLYHIKIIIFGFSLLRLFICSFIDAQRSRFIRLQHTLSSIQSGIPLDMCHQLNNICLLADSRGIRKDNWNCTRRAPNSWNHLK